MSSSLPANLSVATVAYIMYPAKKPVVFYGKPVHGVWGIGTGVHRIRQGIGCNVKKREYDHSRKNMNSIATALYRILLQTAIGIHQLSAVRIVLSVDDRASKPFKI